MGLKKRNEIDEYKKGGDSYKKIEDSTRHQRKSVESKRGNNKMIKDNSVENNSMNSKHADNKMENNNNTLNRVNDFIKDFEQMRGRVGSILIKPDFLEEVESRLEIEGEEVLKLYTGTPVYNVSLLDTDYKLLTIDVKDYGKEFDNVIDI